jgi:polar amino acid transport system substrate-binding protein
MIRLFHAGLCLVLFSIILIGCGNNGDNHNGGAASPSESAATPTETTLAKVQREGYITVGFANENPYAFATPDGKLTGENEGFRRASRDSPEIRLYRAGASR